MSIEVEIYTLPARWTSYLVNGDASSFQLYDDGDEEIARIDAFCDDVGAYCVGAEGDKYFSTFNDAHEKACYVIDYIFHRIVKGKSEQNEKDDRKDDR